jgi:hypothetical protein
MDSYSDFEAAEIELTEAVEALTPHLAALQSLGGIHGEENRALVSRALTMLTATLERGDKEQATVKELRETAAAMRQLHADLTATVLPSAIGSWEPPQGKSRAN